MYRCGVRWTDKRLDVFILVKSELGDTFFLCSWCHENRDIEIVPALLWPEELIVNDASLKSVIVKQRGLDPSLQLCSVLKDIQVLGFTISSGECDQKSIISTAINVVYSDPLNIYETTFVAPDSVTNTQKPKSRRITPCSAQHPSPSLSVLSNQPSNQFQPTEFLP